MKPTTHVQKFATEKETREHLKTQLDQYLGHQPQSTRSLHKWMKRLEILGVGLIVAALVAALYVSMVWKSVDPIVIPIAWFIFAASAAPAMIFLGLDSITLKAFPPVVWPGKPRKFVTGTSAVWAGWAFILLALILAAFWGYFAYAVGTLNYALIIPLITILGVALGIVMTVSIVYKLIHDVSRCR